MAHISDITSLLSAEQILCMFDEYILAAYKLKKKIDHFQVFEDLSQTLSRHFKKVEPPGVRIEGGEMYYSFVETYVKMDRYNDIPIRYTYNTYQGIFDKSSDIQRAVFKSMAVKAILK